MGLQLATLHNLTFYLWLMEQMRGRLKDDTFSGWYRAMAEQVEQKI